MTEISDLAKLERMDYPELLSHLNALQSEGQDGEKPFQESLAALTRLLDRRYPVGNKKRSSIVHLTAEAIEQLLLSLPGIAERARRSVRIDFSSRAGIQSPEPGTCSRLAIDAAEFPPEGEQGLARTVAQAVGLGWRHLILFRLRGQRFVGCGLGAQNGNPTIEVYGSSGDYLASGLDGGEIRVHGSAQDQVGNILKSGRLLIYGDVGQTFLYAAKGGEIYVLGSAAGRPLINAVGTPKTIINGTALDYLGESFMAGDPLQGGGFVIINGVEYDLEGRLREKPTPYPGGNLFSLAAGGAVYLRDPRRRVGSDQLHGGRFVRLSPADWEVLLPLLRENESLFGISIEWLLSVDGLKRPPEEIYRKVEPAPLRTH